MNTSTLFNFDLVSALAASQRQLEESEDLKKKLEERCIAVEAELHACREKLARAERDAQLFLNQLALMRRQAFASRAERHPVDAHLLQTILPGFDAAVDAPTDTEEKQTVTFERTVQGKKGGSVARAERFPEWLRRVVVEVEPTETCCAECGNDNCHVIRYAETEKLCCARDPFYVKVYRRPVLGCRTCDTATTPPPVPDEVFERRAVEETVAADLIVHKFLSGMPLYRQQRRFTDIGITFSVDALIDWVLQSACLLTPVYAALVASVRRAPVLLADETRLLIGNNAPKALRTFRRGALWGMARIDQREFACCATKGRTHAECATVLGGFAGALVVDGADCFEAVGTANGASIVHCNCHARRGFVRARLSNPVEADHALAFYHALYKIEADAASMTPEDRHKERSTRAVPLLAQFRQWLDATQLKALPKTPLHKACDYVLRRWETLTRYTSNGSLPFDTNQLEGLIRTIALARKNFLFCASESGAEAAAVLFSLVITCRLQEIDPFIYLSDVLRRVASHPAANVDELTPRTWKERFLNEALERYQTFHPTTASDSS